jgi:hypothetical protein
MSVTSLDRGGPASLLGQRAFGLGAQTESSVRRDTLMSFDFGGALHPSTPVGVP